MQQGRIVRRRRLTRLLDESPSRVIALVAPAGYGKTTLAHQWLDGEKSPKRASWYRATQSSSDVAAVATGLTRAAGVIVPNTGGSLLGRLRVTGSAADDAELLAEILADDLHDWPEDAWLVFDDYQLASASGAAEQFVETFAFSSPINLLVLSRRRPNWATPRRLIYGDVFEIGRSLLELDVEEAAEVLAGRHAALPGLLALAEGWPAVIGLAALTRVGFVPDDALPERLFEFFADELYGELSNQAKRALSILGLAPQIDDDILSILFGSAAEQVTNECLEAGLLNRRGADGYEVHPLVREFVSERSSRELLPLREATALVEHFLQLSNWDSALEVAQRTSSQTLLARVLLAVLSPLINEGRLHTLEEAVKDGRRKHAPGPAFDLVEAEIAFRRGKNDQCEALAKRAFELLPNEDPTRSRALFRAGQAAYFADRTTEAVRYSKEALRTAHSDPDRLNALWLEFVCTTELEQPEASSVLELIAQAASSDPTDVVRLATCKLILGDRWGGVEEAVAQAEPAYWLVGQVADPMIRSSFLNMLARALIDAGHYSRALTIAEQGLVDVHQTRLLFAVPHMLTPKASALLGLSQVGPALRAADAAINAAQDGHSRANGALLRARVLIALRRFDDARGCLFDYRTTTRDSATRGEVIAHDAFAAACLGDGAAAIEAAALARTTSRTIHTAIVAELARAVARARHANAHDMLDEALGLVVASGHVDYLVLAARSNPQVARLLEASSFEGDATIARAKSLIRPSTERPAVPKLTARETEVLEFVTAGLSNREIADRLFISQVTVKAHMRHILAKLGARSRTEAAVIRARESDSPTPPG